jgi:hypothetical protein
MKDKGYLVKILLMRTTGLLDRENSLFGLKRPESLNDFVVL